MPERNLHPDVIHLLQLNADERIQWIKQPRWFGYPRAHQILEKLEDLVSHPRQTRMPNLLIIGETNNGKSKLVEQFVKRYPVQENPHGEHVIATVLDIETPPSPSEDGFYSEILNRFFEKIPVSSTAARRTRAMQVLRDTQLKVLLIDELHNILAGPMIKQQQVLNMLKFLSNELKISIVACGTGDLSRAISIDPQIQNRFIPELLPKWTMNKEFRELLMSFECILPLKKESSLHDRVLAGKILAMCEGTIGEMSTLLNMATQSAIKNGSEQITIDVLNSCGYVSPSDRTKQVSRF